MAPDTHSPPRTFLGVMVSSTFTDLEAHRAELIWIINGQALHALVMESDSAKPVGDVIDSSLQMVHDSAAYVGLISKKYGQTPPCVRRNPGERSITELEFDEALRLGRPILLFIMGDAHQVLEADVELDPVKRAKLSVFRERAKKEANSEVHRVYAVFESREQFAKQAAQSIAELRRHLEESAPRGVPSSGARGAIRAPDFCSEPPYVGSHAFVGRTAQLDTLSDWARPADPPSDPPVRGHWRHGQEHAHVGMDVPPLDERADGLGGSLLVLVLRAGCGDGGLLPTRAHLRNWRAP
jgi:hypothetical protein